MAVVAFGQNPPPATFDVASVKPSPADPDEGMGMHTTNGRFSCANASLTDLIEKAYGLRDDQINGPGWLRDAHFDIVATFRAGAALKVPEMLQDLLSNRFGLSFHREIRTLPLFALVVSTGGPTMQRDDSTSGLTGSFGRMIREVHGSMTMARFADFLAKQLSCPVVDKTGLTGSYGITLTWQDSLEASDSAESLDQLPRALHKQLGLDLKTEKGPVNVVVIDAVKRQPAENE
jgi:uncharacterized protein (TIGR03435 family)